MGVPAGPQTLETAGLCPVQFRAGPAGQLVGLHLWLHAGLSADRRDSIAESGGAASAGLSTRRTPLAPVAAERLYCRCWGAFRGRYLGDEAFGMGKVTIWIE